MPAAILGAPCRALGRGTPAICAACEIRDFTFCASLDDQELRSVQAIVRPVRLGALQLLFQEGDPADSVYNLVSGVIKLYKLLPDGRRQITGFVYPGDFLGIATGAGHAYNAEAVGDVSLCRFPRRRLFALFERYPKLEHRLFGIATDELTAAQDQMLLLGRKTAAEKLASFLCRLADRTGDGGDADDPILVPMTRGDIADYLGLTVETVSRTFGRLRKAVLVAVPDPHHVVLSDRDGLEDIAEAL